MRSKWITIIAVAVAGFLLATNPVVSEAARKITGKDIKNNSVTTKDIRNNNLTSRDIKNKSLRAVDFKPGQLPRGPSGTIQIERFAGSITQSLAAGGLRFVGPTAEVTVNGTEVVLGGGTANVSATTEGDDTDVALCKRAAGSVAAPTPLGGPVTFGVDLNDNENALPAFGSEILPAGTYDVGMCIAPYSDLPSAFESVGWVQVLASTGPLAPVAPRAADLVQR